MAKEGYVPQLTNDPTWIIDPIDGTMNFVHRFPHTCISLALLIDKKAEIGIIYNPLMQQFFSARRHRGAFLNGKPIKTSDMKGIVTQIECFRIRMRICQATCNNIETRI